MSINKKILAFLMIFPLMNYIGFYSFQQVQMKEFLTSNDKDISIKVNEKGSYLFNGGKYIVQNDTISGEGKFR